MRRRSGYRSGTSRIRTHVWIWVVLWTATAIGHLASDIRHIRAATVDAALSEARVQFDRDQATRLWAASHGGVYVPVRETSPPNPRLSHVPERDIETPSGKRLTLLTPGCVLRQMMDHFSGFSWGYGHITSLDHFRAGSAYPYR
jgi:hypothetical protein